MKVIKHNYRHYKTIRIMRTCFFPGIVLSILLALIHLASQQSCKVILLLLLLLYLFI